MKYTYKRINTLYTHSLKNTKMNTSLDTTRLRKQCGRTSEAPLSCPAPSSLSIAEKNAFPESINHSFAFLHGFNAHIGNSRQYVTWFFQIIWFKLCIKGITYVLRFFIISILHFWCMQINVCDHNSFSLLYSILLDKPTTILFIYFTLGGHFSCLQFTTIMSNTFLNIIMHLSCSRYKDFSRSWNARWKQVCVFNFINVEKQRTLLITLLLNQIPFSHLSIC